MENNTAAPERKRSPVRDWIDPTRIYNPLVPAGRLVFFWGLVVYPLIVMLLLLTPVIIVVMTISPNANNADYLGIVTWVFMLAWVVATVCICRRRLADLGRSQAWVWLAVLPVANLILFLYLFLKAGSVASRRAG